MHNLLKRSVPYSIAIVCAGLCSVATAQGPIVISDGPGQSSSLSEKKTAQQKIAVSEGPQSTPSRPKIITTDGPATMPYVYPPPIVISNGPAHLFYENGNAPEKVVTSDGPSKAGSSFQTSNPKVVIIDSPEPVRLHHHATKKVLAKRNLEAPDPETSTLAPVIPSAVPINRPTPAIPTTASDQIPAESPFASGPAWAMISILGALVLSLLGALAWKRRKI